ncbi:3'-5' exonuclease [Salinispira pacifica]|uniref:DNA polymerase III polC-type n=1 Tax=Salinispira pacifica TaxID=1307761 RepID=V5WFR8_9SPIO|nr:3'-5' exonuclease [Salinispira pacifica]AHC14667.1 DNA polymerase III polC-type [Salinispira pacifica]
MDMNASVYDLTFVAFDFETTGLYSGSDRIVEFGAVKFKGNSILGEFGELVNPGIPIPEDAAKISGITDEMVAAKPAVEKMLDPFIEFIGDSILVAHNASFDMGFLRAALAGSGRSDIKNLLIDTQQLAKRAYPGQKSYSLQNLAGFLNFPLNTAHRAVDDSIQCMKLFNACAQELSFMGEITLKEVLA